VSSKKGPAMRDFHELDIWRKAHQFVLDVYRATDGLPKSEISASRCSLGAPRYQFLLVSRRAGGRDGDTELGVFALTESFDDEGEGEEARKRTSSFSNLEKILRKPLSLRNSARSRCVFVEGRVVFPGFDAIGLRRNHRNHAQAEHQFRVSSPLVGPIHQHRQAFRHRPKLGQQGASFGRVVRIAGQAKLSPFELRGQQMNLWCSIRRVTCDGLGPVFFRAAGPIRMHLIEVESRANASILMRTICSACIFSKHDPKRRS